MTLLAANDVGQKERVERLAKDFDIKVSLTPANKLPCDFVWFANGLKCGIELKVGSDLLGTIAEKRLGSQVQGMLKELDFSLLLWTGKVQHIRANGKVSVNNQTTNWDYRAVMGILGDLHMLGMAVEQWDGDPVERVAAWYLNSQKEGKAQWLKQRSRPNVDHIAYTPYANAVHALSAFPSIGPVMAEVLLKQYGSVSKVVNAFVRGKPETVAEGIKGMGAKTARRLKNELLESFS